MTINTDQLKKILAQYAKVSDNEASAFVDAFIQTILTHAKHEEVVIQGLGTFYVAENVHNKRLAFRPDEKLKEAINAPFAFFEPVVVSEGNDMQATESEIISEPSAETEPVPAIEATVAEIETEIETEEEPLPEPVLPVQSDSEQTAEQPEQIEDSRPIAEQPEKTKISQQNSKKGLWAGVVCALLIVGIFVGWMLLSNRQQPPETQPVIAAQPQIEEVTLNDSIAEEVDADSSLLCTQQEAESAAKDTIVQEKISIEQEKTAHATKDVQTEPAERPKEEQILHNPDGTPTIVSLGAGERLTLLSERLYGDKNFWGYIYEVNAFQIPNPNVVSSKLKLYLPDAVYYHIDAQDPASVKRARQKQHEILQKIRQ